MFEQLKSLLVDKFMIDPEEITLDAELAADLAINSIEQAELVEACAEEFDIEIDDDVYDSVYVAGAKLDGDRLLTAGGRVLGVTAVADNLGDAIKAAYKNVRSVGFANAYYRTDIGARAMSAIKDKA